VAVRTPSSFPEVLRLSEGRYHCDYAYHAVGYDAGLALLDPDRRFTVRAADSPSGQGYTPFEGQELTGQVTATFLRGRLAWENGALVGAGRGRYIARPTAAR
jgi:allantoinase